MQINKFSLLLFVSSLFFTYSLLSWAVISFVIFVMLSVFSLLDLGDFLIYKQKYTIIKILIQNSEQKLAPGK